SLRMADRYDDALAELDHAESLAVASNRTLELARIHHLRGNIYFPLGKIDQCLAEHQAALNFATQTDSTEDQARALGGIGDAYYMAGRMSSAHEHLDRCVELCRAHGLERIEAAYLPMRGTTYMYRLRFTEALDDCWASNEIATRSGHPRGEIISRNISCWTLLDRHDFVRSQQHARIALELIEKIGARRFVPLFNDILARIWLHVGDRAGAVKLLEESLAISRETGITFLGPFVLGAIALAADESTRRRDALNEGEAILSRGCVAHNVFWFYRDAIEVSLAEGAWDQADAYTAALDTYFREEPMAWADFIVARGRALAQFGRGPRAGALQQVRQLRDQAARLNMMAELIRLDAALESASQG
ncbi:MAG: tetratricopeptide repeat protein, partial [Burkholderiales bacterium]